MGATNSSHGQSPGVLSSQPFGDWEVTCGSNNAADAGKLSQTSQCKAVQRLTEQDTGETVLVLTALREAKGKLVGIISIPLGGYLVPGLELTVDQQKPYKLLIETCTSTGCHAGFPLTGRVEKELRSGRQATFRVWTTKSTPADIPVSLEGFSDALDELERRS